LTVTVNFDKAVSNKATVESKIQVSSSSDQWVVGHWFNDDRLDLRARNYWKPGSIVTVKLSLHGFQKTVTFKIGRSQISTGHVHPRQLLGLPTRSSARSTPATAAWGTSRAAATASSPRVVRRQLDDR
jgi:hypothetical protein